MSNKTVFLVAGGTGGHVFPAIALAEELLKRGIDVECITDKRGERYFASTNLTPHVVASSAWAKKPMDRLKAAAKILQGMFQSWILFRQYPPGIVMGFGGYPSFPTLKTAQLLKIPTVLHEQNAIFGRANRQLARLAKRIFVSFPDTKSLPLDAKARIKQSGNPVRTAFTDNIVPYEAPDEQERVNLLIFSGSQGSTLFSQTVPGAIALLDEALKLRLSITQQTREEDVAAVKKAYADMKVHAVVKPFFDNMARQYQQAHLVLARAGATTITEMTAMGRPGIYIPLAASLDGDQAQNAAYLVAHNAGWLVEEKDFTPEKLAARLQEILQGGQLQATADAARRLGTPDAAQKLADIITKNLK